MFIPEAEYKVMLEKLPILCVDLLIIYNNECLLLKRNNEPAKGQYWFPGGRLQKLEIIEKASVRKAKEETNLDCTYIKMISVEETIFPKNENLKHDIHTVNVCCLLETEDISNLIIDKYHDDFIWVKKQDPSYHFAVNHPISLIGM